VERSHLLAAGAYRLFVVVGCAELVALWAIGESQIVVRVLIPLAFLIVWLGRRSRTAWWLFLLANGVVVLSTLSLALGSSSGDPSAGGAVM
jgi:hypothetical protein